MDDFSGGVETLHSLRAAFSSSLHAQASLFLRAIMSLADEDVLSL
jgi:hypothetical protein